MMSSLYKPMDAVVLDIEQFHTVTAICGTAFGDEVLCALGKEILAFLQEQEGFGGHVETDIFAIYCTHLEEPRALLDRLQGKLDLMSINASLRLRMGVMPWQAGLEAVQMFDRARTACSMARESYNDHLIVFDRKMQEREAYEQRLLNELHQALSSYEFEVYYQPQYDIQCDPPKMISAEALVRWNHPELGLIPPNDFVPLLDKIIAKARKQ